MYSVIQRRAVRLGQGTRTKSGQPEGTLGEQAASINKPEQQGRRQPEQ